MTGPLIALGFDYGRRRIGVAVGQRLTGTTTPLTTVHCRQGHPDWGVIAGLLRTWQPDILVVGLPKLADGSEGEVARAARRFGRQLEGRYRLPVIWVDERLTSHEAEALLKDGERRRDSLDSVAAELILLAWLAR